MQSRPGATGDRSGAGHGADAGSGVVADGRGGRGIGTGGRSSPAPAPGIAPGPPPRASLRSPPRARAAGRRARPARPRAGAGAGAVVGDPDGEGAQRQPGLRREHRRSRLYHGVRRRRLHGRRHGLRHPRTDHRGDRDQHQVAEPCPDQEDPRCGQGAEAVPGHDGLRALRGHTRRRLSGERQEPRAMEQSHGLGHPELGRGRHGAGEPGVVVRPRGGPHQGDAERGQADAGRGRDGDADGNAGRGGAHRRGDADAGGPRSGVADDLHDGDRDGRLHAVV